MLVSLLFLELILLSCLTLSSMALVSLILLFNVGRYYYMEASGRREGERARLQFRPFRLYYRACLKFYYHMYGADMGTLMVVLNGQLVWKLHGNQGNQWRIAVVPILHPGVIKVFKGPKIKNREFCFRPSSDSLELFQCNEFEI